MDLALLKIAEGDWDDFCKGWKFGDLPSVADLVKREGKNAEVVATMMDPPSAVVVAGDGDSTTDDGNGKNNATTSKKKSSSADSICLTLSSGLPKLDENVTCVGFPQGGTQISVTRGVVSRIDVDAHYVLRIQIDAAINPGVSFFLLLCDAECTSIAISQCLFQSCQSKTEFWRTRLRRKGPGRGSRQLPPPRRIEHWLHHPLKDSRHVSANVYGRNGG